MDQIQIRQIYDRYIRREADYPNFTREELPGIVRLAPQSGDEHGFIAYARLDEGNVQAAIEAQIAYFEELGVGFEWKLYDYDTPTDLKERLAQCGFEIGEDEAILFLDLKNLPEQLRLPVQADVRRLEPGDPLDDPGPGPPAGRARRCVLAALLAPSVFAIAPRFVRLLRLLPWLPAFSCPPRLCAVPCACGRWYASVAREPAGCGGAASPGSC